MISNNKIKSQSGQSLIEIIIGLSIGSALVGAAVVAIVFMLRSGAINQKLQIAAGLNQEMVNKTKTVVSANWNDLFNKDKGPNTQYYVNFAAGRFVFANGVTSTVIEGTSYTSFFSVENVNRDDNGNIVEMGGVEDPSTQKVTIYSRWPSAPQTSEVKIIDYLTRWENAVFQQTDWSGGQLSNEIVSEPNDKFTNSTNVDFFSSSGVIKIQGF